MTILSTVCRVVLCTVICSVALSGCVKKGADDKSAGGEGMRPVKKAGAMSEAVSPDKAGARRVAKPADMATTLARVAAKRPVRAAPGSYVIKFDRPLKVGMRLTVVASGGRAVKTRVAGKASDGESYKYTWVYVGVAIIKAVNSTGSPSWVQHKVAKLTVTMKGKTQALLQAGDVIDARAKGNDVLLTVGGRPLSAKATTVFGEVVDIRVGNAISNDAIFGPGAPKRPGDTWTPNWRIFLASLKKGLPRVALWPKVSDVTGRVTLVSAQKVDGVDVLKVWALAKLKNIAPQSKSMKVTGGSMKFEIVGWLPQDVSVVGGGMEMRIAINVKGEITQGSKTQAKVMVIRQHKKLSRKPLPKSGATESTGGGASKSPGGSALGVNCEQMCSKTFKKCIVETLVTSTKITRQKIEQLRKIPGVMDKMQQAGYSTCKKDCSMKKGFGTDASQINACLKLTSCAKYARCIKKHIR